MRTLIRSVLILAVLACGAFVLLGYWTGSSLRGRTHPAAAGGTVDTEKARERGAELGEKAAMATERIRDTAHDAGITTKIKAKLALDDTIKARAIDVNTDGSTVTMSGTVSSAAERDRALALARETSGVTRVIDRIQIRGQ